MHSLCYFSSDNGDTAVANALLSLSSAHSLSNTVEFFFIKSSSDIADLYNSRPLTPICLNLRLLFINLILPYANYYFLC